MKTSIQLRIERLFLEKFDKWCERKGYSTRTQAIVEAMREKMESCVGDAGEA